MPEGLYERMMLAIERSGLRQTYICKALGISLSYFSMVKTKGLTPSIGVLTYFATITGVSLDWLVYGVDRERMDARQVLPCKCGGKQIRIAIHPGRVSAETTYSLYCPACDGESDKRHVPADAIISWNSKNNSTGKTWLI